MGRSLLQINLSGVFYGLQPSKLKENRRHLCASRSRNGNEMLEFHGGSFRCATKSKCPILPLALIDSFKVLDQKGSDPVTVQMHYLPVIPYEEYADLKPAQLAELVRSRIQEAIQAHI